MNFKSKILLTTSMALSLLACSLKAMNDEPQNAVMRAPVPVTKADDSASVSAPAGPASKADAAAAAIPVQEESSLSASPLGTRIFISVNDSLMKAFLRHVNTEMPEAPREVKLLIVSYLDRSFDTAWKNEKEKAAWEGRRPVFGRGWKKSYMPDLTMTNALRRGVTPGDGDIVIWKRDHL
jgi:hypothetical protein